VSGGGRKKAHRNFKDKIETILKKGALTRELIDMKGKMVVLQGTEQKENLRIREERRACQAKKKTEKGSIRGKKRKTKKKHRWGSKAPPRTFTEKKTFTKLLGRKQNRR